MIALLSGARSVPNFVTSRFVLVATAAHELRHHPNDRVTGSAGAPDHAWSVKITKPGDS